MLKALYDAIGSSIKIPNNGTKTLKLRLSVGQEPLANTDGGQAIAGKTEKLDNIKEEKQTKNTPKKKDNVKVKDNSNVKTKDKLHKDTCKVKDISRLNNLVGSNSKGTPKCNNETQAATQSTAAKARLGSHKHKELVSLVQENMERNHIKPLR